MDLTMRFKAYDKADEKWLSMDEMAHLVEVGYGYHIDSDERHVGWITLTIDEDVELYYANNEGIFEGFAKGEDVPY